MSDEPSAQTQFAIPDRLQDGIVRARDQIKSTGAWWSGAQRVEIATAARRTSLGEDFTASTAPAAATAMAATIATESHTITDDQVAAFAAEIGTGLEAYVEIVGIVARTTAIDTTMRGIGAPLIDLGEGDPEPPAPQPEGAARKRSAFVPTMGPAGATSALSSVRIEDAAQEDLHGALYLSYFEMSQLTIDKGLPRWQLELVAARTSLLNKCFF